MKNILEIIVTKRPCRDIIETQRKSGKTAEFSRFTNTDKEAPSMFLRNVESTWGNIFQTNLLDKLVFPYAIPAREMAELSDLGPQEENFYRTEDFLR